jgi:hypothetical protein
VPTTEKDKSEKLVEEEKEADVKSNPAPEPKPDDEPKKPEGPT